MTDNTELKRLAEVHVQKDIVDPVESKRVMLVEPKTVLALIAENERLERKNANQSESIREYQDLVMGGDVSLGMLKADIRVTAGERDQLRAEVAGLKTGYEAYERVNAELKAENEELRKDAVKWEVVKRTGDQLLADEGRAAIWSACSRILISVASELNSGLSVVTEEGVTKGGVNIGDWRVTVERIDAALGQGEQS